MQQVNKEFVDYKSLILSYEIKKRKQFTFPYAFKQSLSNTTVEIVTVRGRLSLLTDSAAQLAKFQLEQGYCSNNCNQRHTFCLFGFMFIFQLTALWKRHTADSASAYTQTGFCFYCSGAAFAELHHFEYAVIKKQKYRNIYMEKTNNPLIHLNIKT